jgi:hypothetical protein
VDIPTPVNIEECVDTTSSGTPNFLIEGKESQEKNQVMTGPSSLCENNEEWSPIARAGFAEPRHFYHLVVHGVSLQNSLEKKRY